MVVLNDLATAVRKSGLPVVETQGWKSRGHGPFVAVETIVCHHTAGPSTGNMPSLGVVTNGRPGLSGPLCNLGLARDGTVYVVAAGIAWHAGVVRSSAYQNTHAIGIEAEATGTGPWSSVQMDAYAKLCRALCEHYGIPISRVLGHKEVCSPAGRKIDPNFDMGAFRKRVTNASLEDDMPLTDADVKKIVDGLRPVIREEVASFVGDVVKVPEGDPSFDPKNPTIRVAGALSRILGRTGKA